MMTFRSTIQAARMTVVRGIRSRFVQLFYRLAIRSVILLALA